MQNGSAFHQSLPPEMRQMMANPEFLRMAMRMNSSMMSGSGFGAGGGVGEYLLPQINPTLSVPFLSSQQPQLRAT